jgi:hypothetical protein
MFTKAPRSTSRTTRTSGRTGLMEQEAYAPGGRSPSPGLPGGGSLAYRAMFPMIDRLELARSPVRDRVPVPDAYVQIGHKGRGMS